MLIPLATLTALLLRHAQAHGDHAQEPLSPDADWATRHMAEEHHINSFDAGSFFNLHDFDSTNEWTLEDLLKTYGLRDESTNHIAQSEKENAMRKVIGLYDRDASGTVSFAEYTIGEAQGIKLPDFGFGPGHHGDDEYEYEIHHFEKYHDENTREEDLIHPEDIEHFRKHDEMEAQQDWQEKMDRGVAEALEMDREVLIDALIERAKEGVGRAEAVFPREWWMVMLCLLAWGLFWEMAERHQDNAHAQFLTWLAVLMVWWVVDVL